MRLLFVGDVVSKNGVKLLRSALRRLKSSYNADIVVVNGENSAVGNGITTASADELLSCGADVITTGNHAFKWRDSYSIFDRDNVLRPANYPRGCRGKGVCILDFGKYQVAVVNLLGTLFMESYDNPFYKIDELLEQLDTPNIFLDFHAEATSEKKAMGHYLTGKITALFGTHTHVQTADEIILGNHTAYITDVGMTGAELSVIGVAPDSSITRMKEHLQGKYIESDAKPFLNAVVVDFNEENGAANSIERIIFRNEVHNA